MKFRKWIGGGLAVFILLVLILLGISTISNRRLPTASAEPAKLAEAEKARLAEFFHLQQQLGERIWPGWGTADIPVIVYNEAYAFLVGYPDPPAGWVKVPQNRFRGNAWELVSDDTFAGKPYYRQPLPATGETPEAFTVKVGDRWVASMNTKEWMEISLRNQFKEQLPAFLKPIFPYPFVTDLFIRGSDGYITALAHESFHAYQGMEVPEKLTAAENIVSVAESDYPWQDAAFQEAWQIELDLLAAAIQAEDEAEALALVDQFLAQREQRRQETGLTNTLIEYEKEREWLEGLARYVELENWRQAAQTEGYTPVSALQDDPDFADYAAFDRRWSQEIDQMGRMADDAGDGRFYYSGMAQAVLLDRLMPDWKRRLFSEMGYLEELLASVDE